VATIEGNGTLTLPESGKLLANVSYMVNHIPPTKERFGEWTGSLVVTQKHGDGWDIFDEVGEALYLELEDGRKGKIIVTHWRPTSTNSVVQFDGTGPLE